MKAVITDITGIGPAAAAALGEQGLGSVKALARASVDQVSAVPGFSAARAQNVIAAAAELLGTAADNPETGSKDKKDKKDKKKKKKDKGKNKK
jgi:Helix-hairpin-helix domain